MDRNICSLDHIFFNYLCILKKDIIYTICHCLDNNFACYVACVHVCLFFFFVHGSAFGCPYSMLNMNKESTLQDRLGSTRAEEGSAAPSALRIKTEFGGEIR